MVDTNESVVISAGVHFRDKPILSKCACFFIRKFNYCSKDICVVYSHVLIFAANKLSL